MPAQTDWLLIRAGRLIDGTGAPASSQAAILIRGERIVEVGPIAAVKPPADLPGREIDARDATVIPGLIDCHLHVTYSGHMGIGQLEWPASLEYAAVCAGANAARALSCGYTSALDIGCRGNIGVATRDAIANGIITGPTLRVSGQIISTVGGPLDLWPSSMRFDPSVRLTTLVSGVEDLRRTIREQVRSGVDNVKLQITRSTVQGLRGGRPVTFTPEELRVAAEFAHDQGLSASVHAEGPQAIREAIEAGFDTIQHASFIDAPAIDVLERHPATRLVFTLGVYDDIFREGPGLGYPATSVDLVRESWPRMVDGVRLAYERGVPFAAGSDCGGAVHPHGRYARDVVLLARQCGIPVEHAIRAATLHAAQAAWLPETGTLTPGSFADLVVVAGDLLSRIELIERQESVRTVVKRGGVVKGPTRAGRTAEQVAAAS